MVNPLTKITPRPSRRNIDYWLKVYLLSGIIGVIGGGVAILLRISIDGIQNFFIDILLPSLKKCPNLHTWRSVTEDQ